jgi:ubiquinone/menaquinone biosynthesis C-methylase UbiE
LYSFNVIPELGNVLINDKESYQVIISFLNQKYLVESIRKFPKQKEFVEMIKDENFKFVQYRNILSGVCAIHSGIKI